MSHRNGTSHQRARSPLAAVPDVLLTLTQRRRSRAASVSLSEEPARHCHRELKRAGHQRRTCTDPGSRAETNPSASSRKMHYSRNTATLLPDTLHTHSPRDAVKAAWLQQRAWGRSEEGRCSREHLQASSSAGEDSQVLHSTKDKMWKTNHSRRIKRSVLRRWQSTGHLGNVNAPNFYCLTVY